MERKREQAAAKQTFVFLHSLTSMRLLETDRECGARACEYGKKKRTSGCEADICFSALLNEHASVGDRQGVRSTGMRVWKEEENKRLRSKGNLWKQEK